MAKINILHVIAMGDVNGGKTYLLNIADNHTCDRYNLFFATPYKELFIGELNKRGIEPFIINIESQFNVFVVGKLVRYIRSHSIHIVHTHGARANFYGRVAARWAKVPVILSTVHNSLYDFPVPFWKKKIYLFLDKFTSTFCDRLICVSKKIADDLTDKSKIAREKITVIYNGIHISECKSSDTSLRLSKEFGLSEHQPVIGVIGRMSVNKGQRYLIEALPRLKKKFPDIVCLLVGDGPKKANLQGLVVKMGLSESCRFTGVRTDIYDIFCLLNLLVLPSVSGEGFPMILLEAMAHGCPIVATDIGGVNEMIEHSKNGLLVKPADSQALSEAILELLSEPKKADQLLNEALRSVGEKFSVKPMIAATERIYEQALKDKGING